MQIPFPAVTVCNQNRVHCKKLEEAKNFCMEINKMSIPERYEHMLESQHGRRMNANTSIVVHKTKDRRQKIEADYTICDKMSVSENKSIIEYLFDQGKCGDICRNGKLFNLYNLQFIFLSIK